MKRPLGVMLIKTQQHHIRIKYIVKPDRLKAKMKAKDFTVGKRTYGCFVMDGRGHHLAGVLLYKLRADVVTLRLMASDFCWRGPLIEFKRAIRRL